MATYDSYKDSGVKWLGQIPSHWEVKKLRSFLCPFSDRNHADKQLLSVTRDRGVIVRGAKGDDDNHNVIPEDLSGYKYVQPGDFIINKMKSWQGSYGVSDFEGIVSPAYFTYHLKIANRKFFSLALRSKAYIPFFMQFSKGIRVDQWDLTPDALKAIPFFLPPQKEQEAIVSYLDKVTADIDKAIEAQQKMIDALNERKQIIITRAVTRGLNPDAPLKDSGIDWLGQIPEHWEIVPLKSRCKFGQSLNITKADLTEDGYPVVSYGQIHSKLNSRTSLTDELIRFVPEVYATKYPNCICHKGDFLVADTSEDLLGCGNVVYIDQDADILAGYHTYSLKNVSIGNPKFLAYLLASDIWRFQIRSLVNAVKVYTISKSIIKQSLIWFPSKKEQDAIVDSLDVAISKIDDMLKVSRNTISLLQERKQIIINEVVTGKKKVI